MALATDRVLLVHPMRLESIGSRVDITSRFQKSSLVRLVDAGVISCLDHDEEDQE